MHGVIDVFIPSSSSKSSSDPTPQVQFDFVTASGGEQVIWAIFNANPAVDKVRIEFSGGKPYFNPPHPHQFTKTIPSGQCSIIYGKVPLSGTMQIRADKYSIIGLDSDGEPVNGVELDPTIIVKEP